MRNRNRRWLLAWTLASLFPHIMLYEVATENGGASSSNPKEVRGLLAPRMNYEQWIPLGRGDPLKNDPTYDYVPPVLDRVHYWIDPASRKPDAPHPGDSQKTEILVLGVSSKKPSTGTSAVADSRRDVHDPFLKFVEGPKFGIQNNYQRMSRPHYAMSSYYPVFENKDNDLYANIGEGVPYTMLMPPPPVPFKRPEVAFQQATTESPVTVSTVSNSLANDAASSYTIQQANLLYHSSTLGNQDEFRDKGQFGFVGAPSSQVTWRTPLANPPNPANNVVFGQNSTTTRDESQIMHKGQVADDDLDISNTYVNIGKPEAQMHSPTDMEISSVSVEPPRLPARQSPFLMAPSTSTNLVLTPTSTLHLDIKKPSPFVSKPQITPMTLQTLQTMQTMKAPPIYQEPVTSFTMKTTNSLHNLLQKEVTSNFIPTTAPTTTPPTTTTITSLTTDPLFKHYKQPTEPLRGPMYLIIQGHSKVKTYGPSKQIHGIAIQEANEIPTSDEKDEYTVKHLHGYKKDSNESRLRQGRSSKLQTLSHVVQTGLGAIEFSETATDRRKDDNVQEAEFIVRYDVSSQADTTSERYYKGIVEAGDMARNIKDARNM